MQGRFSEMMVVVEEEEEKEESHRAVSHKFYLQHSRKLLSDFGDCLVKLSTTYVLKLCILATHTKNHNKHPQLQEKINLLPFSSRVHISASIDCSLSAAQMRVALTLQSATYAVTQNININTSNLKQVTFLFICVGKKIEEIPILQR